MLFYVGSEASLSRSFLGTTPMYILGVRCKILLVSFVFPLEHIFRAWIHLLKYHRTVLIIIHICTCMSLHYHVRLQHENRCLELPPRLLNEAKVMSMPSPTTVLDGPDVGRSVSNTWSLRGGGSFRSPDGGSKRSELKGKVLFFGSTRWAPLKEKSGGDEGEDDDPFSILEEGGGGVGLFTSPASGEPKVKIKRVKRRASLLNLPHTKSHLWVSVVWSNRSRSRDHVGFSLLVILNCRNVEQSWWLKGLLIS